MLAGIVPAEKSDVMHIDRCSYKQTLTNQKLIATRSINCNFICYVMHMPSKCTEELFSQIVYFLLLDFSILCKISNPSQPNNAQEQQDRHLSIEQSMFYSQLLGSSKFHNF